MKTIASSNQEETTQSKLIFLSILALPCFVLFILSMIIGTLNITRRFGNKRFLIHFVIYVGIMCSLCKVLLESFKKTDKFAKICSNNIVDKLSNVQSNMIKKYG